MNPAAILAPQTRPWLPRTGQVTAYRTGDDGTFQAGRPGTTRFVDAGAGTIFDRHTGLTWVKQPELIIPGAVGVHATNQIQVARGDWANATVYAAADLAKDTAGATYWVCAVAHTSAAAPTTFAQDRAANPTYWRQTVWTASAANLLTPATMIWNAAIDNSLGTRWGGTFVYAGFTDWRLPNILEIVSISDFTVATAPCINLTLFPNTQFAYYWSSTPYVPGAATVVHAWRGDHDENRTIAVAKTTPWVVRPVRGGRTILG